MLGGMLEDGKNGMINYVGGSTKCIWISQDMRVTDVLKLVEQAMGVSVREFKVWYSMKFDRKMMLPFKDDGDVVSMMRENDGHGYLYVGGMGGQCGRRPLANEQAERPHGESNAAGVVEQRGFVGCEDGREGVLQNNEGAGVVTECSR